MSDHENMTSDRIRQQMMVRNPIVLNPKCSSCGVHSNTAKPPDDWEHNGCYGWLCPDCKADYSE